ncbi:MAG TPA: GAF domain-containing protein [Candidatus Binatia bacterium]|jgi:signal transduction histidine kinase
MELASEPSAAPTPATKRAALLIGISASLVAIQLFPAIFLSQHQLVPVAWFVPAALAFYFGAALSIALLSFGRFLFRKEPYAFWVGLAFWISSLFSLAQLVCLESVSNAPDTDAAYFFYLSFLALLLPAFYLIAKTPTLQISSWRALFGRLAWVSLGCILLAGTIFLLEDLLTPLFLSARAAFFSALLLYGFFCLYAGAAWIHWRRFQQTEAPLIGYVCSFLLLCLGVFLGLILSRQPYDFAWFSSYLFPVIGCSFFYLALLLEYLDLYRELDRTVDQMVVTHRLNTLVSSSLSLEEICRQLSWEIRKLVPYDRLAVNLLQKDQNYLKVYSEESALPAPAVPEGFSTKAGTATGWAIDHKEPLLCADLSQERRFEVTRGRYQGLGLRSFIILPLIAKGQIFGAMNLGSLKPNQYNRKDIDTLTPVAEILSIAVENAKLYQESQRHAEIQSLLKEVTQDITTLDVNNLLQKLTRKVCAVLKTDVSDVRLMVDGSWRSLGISGIEPTRLQSSASGTGLRRSRLVIESRKPMVVEDMSRETPVRQGNRSASLGFRGYVGVPLFKKNGEVIGVLRVLTYKPRDFSPDEVDLLQQLASGAAIAIENTTLLEEARQKSLHLEALIKVNRDVASLLKKELLLPSIANEARRFLNVDGASFRLVEGRSLVRACFAGEEELLALTPVMPLGESVTGKIVRENRVIAIKNVRHDPVMVEKHRRILSESGYHSFLGVPLRLGSRVIGTVNLYSKQEREFRPDEIQMITAFADQTAIAVQNARLFEELQMKSGELEDAFRTKTDFLNTMAHELRTPLNVVIGTQQLLLDGSYGSFNDEQGKALERIGRYAQDLLSLINEILDLVRLDARKVPVRASEFSVNDITDDLELSFAPLAREKGLDLRFDIDAGMPSIKSDRSKIREILQNLLANAVKYTEKGEVELRVSMQSNHRNFPGKHILWSVRDTGIGIDQSDLPHLFEPFYMADGVDRRKYPGTGLGLSIVKRLVELLDGDIKIESELGKGSTFTVTFPVADPE